MPFFHRTHTVVHIVGLIIKKNIYYTVKYAMPNPHLLSVINPLIRQYDAAKKQNQAIGEADNYEKRAVPSASSMRGSLTVEAALALPICLGVLFLLMGLFQVMSVSEQVNGRLCTAARRLAAYSEAISGSNTAEAYRFFYSSQGNGSLDIQSIQGGYGGIILSLSEDTENGLLNLKAVYYIRVPGYLITGRSVKVQDSVYIRPWVGDNLSDGDESEKETASHQVYVAENGVVYHNSENCTYLRLSVSQVSFLALEGLRNQYGARYAPCERCSHAVHAGSVYITGQGTAWHTDRGCSGLKRILHTMNKDEALQHGLRPCSRCGG